MIILKFIKWVLMSKDRKYIIKGANHDRELIPVNDKKDKKRLVTYDSEAKAQVMVSRAFGSDYHTYDEHEGLLEPVKVRITIEEIE